MKRSEIVDVGIAGSFALSAQYLPYAMNPRSQKSSRRSLSTFFDGSLSAWRMFTRRFLRAAVSLLPTIPATFSPAFETNESGSASRIVARDLKSATRDLFDTVSDAMRD